MDLGITPKLEPLLEKVKAFIAEEVVPMEGPYRDEINTGDRWQFTARQTEIIETLKRKARERGPVELLPHGGGAQRRSDHRRVRLPRGSDGAIAPRPGGVQLRGAGHGQHGSAGEVRQRGAEGGVAEAPARRRDPQRLCHDRAGVASSDATNISTARSWTATSG
jgi:hypothetical protein